MTGFNLLWQSDVIWRHTFGSALVQVMTFCLMAPRYYLNPCWLLINEFFWHSAESNFTRNVNEINPWHILGITCFTRLLSLFHVYTVITIIFNGPGWIIDKTFIRLIFKPYKLIVKYRITLGTCIWLRMILLFSKSIYVYNFTDRAPRRRYPS